MAQENKTITLDALYRYTRGIEVDPATQEDRTVGSDMINYISDRAKQMEHGYLADQLLSMVNFLTDKSQLLRVNFDGYTNAQASLTPAEHIALHVRIPNKDTRTQVIEQLQPLFLSRLIEDKHYIVLFPLSDTMTVAEAKASYIAQLDELSVPAIFPSLKAPMSFILPVDPDAFIQPSALLPDTLAILQAQQELQQAIAEGRAIEANNYVALSNYVLDQKDAGNDLKEIYGTWDQLADFLTKQFNWVVDTDSLRKVVTRQLKKRTNTQNE